MYKFAMIILSNLIPQIYISLLCQLVSLIFWYANEKHFIWLCQYIDISSSSVFLCVVWGLIAKELINTYAHVFGW